MAATTTTAKVSSSGLTTEEFAKLNRVKPQSVTARLCRTGSYFGITPLKLANGRLIWTPALATANGPRAA